MSLNTFLFKLFNKKPEKGFIYLGGGNVYEEDEGNLTGLYMDYFCWNQNGFNNALYDKYDVADWDPKNFKGYSPKKWVREQAKDCYPEKYPCFMRIWTYHTFESGRLHADFDY